MKKPLGFSLLELMVAIAVLAIVAAFAFPNFQTLVQNNRQTAKLNDLVTSLNLARSEAVTRGHRVGVCTSTDGTACNGGTNWHNGWFVFLDVDDDGFGAGDEIVSRRDAFDDRMTFTTSTATIAYRATGFKFGTLGLTLLLCDSRGTSAARALVVSSLGRPRTTPDASGGTCP
ncbi:MAG: GspH/FimT family pseudopilin [Gammaproteobacteria bacterium]